MKKSDLFIFIVLFSSPILINYLILGISLGATVNGSIDGWLNFYGDLVGSVITMFVLYRTRTWNTADNEYTRNIQNNILKYQSKKMWLEGFRKQLDTNYSILNFQETIIASNDIATGNCLKAMNYLLQLNKDIEMQSYSFDLYLPQEKLYDPEIEYQNCYRNILKQYGEYVNDLIIICGIRIQVAEGGNIILYINALTKQIKLLNEKDSNITPSPFLKSLEEKLNSTCTFDELEKMCISRVLDVGFIHVEKTHLQKVTNQLLNFEENSIENILLMKTTE